jgi:hypothetical protein
VSGTGPRWLDRTARLATSGAGVALVAAWSFAEAIVLPIVPDVVLDLFGLATPRRAPLLFLVAVVGSVAGTIVLFALASTAPATAQSLILAVPAIDPPMLDAARVTVAAGDPASLALFGPGTPLKVYSLAWAAGGGPLVGLLIGAVVNRLTRIGPALLGCVGVGAVAPAWLRRHERLVLGLYTIFWLATYLAYWTGLA